MAWSSTPAQSSFAGKIQHYYRNCLLYYSNEEHCASVRSLVPLDRIQLSANDMIENGREFKTTTLHENKQESLVLSLLDWFKDEFFAWVNSPACHFCQSKTECTGMGSPNPEDIRGNANRIELYTCSTCNSVTRFPRYNNPLTLMQSRKGRCGEWANAFTMICCSVGIQARLILDMTDHVWTEIFFSDPNTGGKWYHVDSCERAFNIPLMYEKGWGKKLSYVFAFTKRYIVDVSPRYTQKWENLLPQRNAVAEDWLAGHICYANFTILTGGAPHFLTWSDDERKQIIVEMKQEWDDLKTIHQRNAGASQEELQGRQSGAEEWRASRGEMGSTGHVTELPQSFSKENSRNLFTFKQFGPTITLSCIGDAVLANNRLVLTENKPSQVGACWFVKPFSIEQSLVIRFSFQILHAGADGFAFVMQTEGKHAIGKGGGSKGYGGIPHCLAVEFDTYENYQESQDPNGNHISIQSRRALPNSSCHSFSLGCAEILPCQLSDSQEHEVVIVFDRNHVKHRCIIELDGKVVLAVPLLLTEIFSSPNVFLGFTAGTGGISQTHIITSWDVSRPK